MIPLVGYTFVIQQIKEKLPLLGLDYHHVRTDEVKDALRCVRCWPLDRKRPRR